ncbi:shikimate dehydrogenase [Helicobacter mesocricetorum]|uniref:shikimate dehydrogenase n=1 Tax=Helicobacter mesocricetorum TaxID=87012 RepID=UPI000CF0DB41|nr:shikimate dehydrogenase [Helicobacter mesocricetorum]
MQFVVVGNPIHHSLSPLLHNYAFRLLGINAFYGRYCLSQEKDFRFLETLGLKGANITIPFKEIAFRSCDETFGIAKKIEAVNTIIFCKGKIFGYNTDAMGFYQCIESFKFKNALILGAGGSSKALACILQEKNIDTTILNRSSERLKSFSGFEAYTFDSFKPKKTYDIVINATPSGLIENSLPMQRGQLIEILKDAQLAFDLIYGRETPFLALAKSLQIPIQDGKNMLINQAILAFEIFMESQGIVFDKNLLSNAMRTSWLI